MQIDVWVLRKKRTKDELAMNLVSGTPIMLTERAPANWNQRNAFTDYMVVPATLRVDLK